MRFSNAQKSTQNRKNEQRWRPKATHRATFGWPGGMRGATGEGTMGRGQRSSHEFCMQCKAEFCRMLTCVRHALPRLEARGGGKRERAMVMVACCVAWSRGPMPNQVACCVVGLWGCGVCVCVYVFYWPRGSQKASKICFVRQLLLKPNKHGTKIDHKWDQSWPGGGEGATEN